MRGLGSNRVTIGFEFNLTLLACADIVDNILPTDILTPFPFEIRMQITQHMSWSRRARQAER